VSVKVYSLLQKTGDNKQLFGTRQRLSSINKGLGSTMGAMLQFVEALKLLNNQSINQSINQSKAESD